MPVLVAPAQPSRRLKALWPCDESQEKRQSKMPKLAAKTPAYLPTYLKQTSKTSWGYSVNFQVNLLLLLGRKNDFVVLCTKQKCTQSNPAEMLCFEHPREMLIHSQQMGSHQQ